MRILGLDIGSKTIGVAISDPLGWTAQGITTIKRSKKEQDLEEIKKILVDEMQIDPSDVKPEAELVNDLGINSLELADLICLCEENFDIEIEDDDLRGFITVGDVVKYLEEKTA